MAVSLVLSLRKVHNAPSLVELNVALHTLLHILQVYCFTSHKCLTVPSLAVYIDLTTFFTGSAHGDGKFSELIGA